MSRKAFKGGVTDTSTTLTNMGEVGDKRFEDGKTYRLVYCATTQADDAFLVLDSVDAALASYTVQAATASTQAVFGVNNTGSLASGTYFWALCEGKWSAGSAKFSTLATIAAELPLVLNSDLTMGSTLASNTQPFGTTLVSVSSLTSVTSATTTFDVYVKGIGA